MNHYLMMTFLLMNKSIFLPTKTKNYLDQQEYKVVQLPEHHLDIPNQEKQNVNSCFHSS